ncbi:uncharacterized protein LOC132188734 isoform X1 [Corylus avellana]|uniref:uncharacterized protein LOC132188734 isoform X1 n=1 Tax=Corylus avellana TaxID=13451 RepID=UPI00286A8991|nr:uncharacterized protein LOC132188734 isoform X1 [Corylus avellana]
MGGKGRRRREKNYKAAHGGYSRLPPPPKSSQVDALPSKLRKLISFTSALSSKPHGSAAKDDAGDKKPRPKDGLDSGASGIKGGGNDEHLRTPQYVDDSDDIVQSSTNEKRKRKRKSMKVDDLRFETLDNPDTNPKRRERKKKYLEARKKKHKKDKMEADLDFPGHEKIKFGEVVEAPPKLLSVPKAFKNAPDASQERIRLRAIEAYRNRKGWASRPGIQLLPPVTSSSPAF